MKDLEKLSKSELIAKIEEMQKTEQSTNALKEYEPLFFKIAENYPNSYISIIEKDLTIGFTSGQEFKKQNLDPKSFIGLSLNEIFGEHATFVTEKYLKAFKGEEISFELFINNQYQLYKVVPLYDSNQNISRILTVVENITKRKKAEDALKENEERFRQMFETHNAVMLLIEPETGKIIDANLSAQNFYGYSDEAFKQMIIQDINSLPEEKVFELRKQAQKENQNYFVFPHCLASGEIRIVEVHSSPIIVNKKQILFSIIHDITERKQVEEEKAKIYNSIQTAVYIYDFVKSKNDYINPEYTKLLGWTIDDINKMGNKFTELFHPDDFKQLVKHMQIVSKDTEDNTHILEYRFKHKNGQWRWCLSYDTPFQRKVNGDVEKMIGSFIDITERKQAEELLLKNKNRLEYALNSIKTGAWELDLETMGSWRMFKHDQIFGHNEPLDEWTYDMFLEHVIPEDREIVNQKFQHAIATKTDWNFECRIKRNNDGKIRWIWANGNQESDGDKEFGKMFGIVQDITEKKQAENTQRETYTRHSAMIENISDVIVIMDADGITKYQSPNIEKWFGWKPVDIIGTNGLEMVHPDDIERIQKELINVVKKERSSTIEFRFKCKDGNYKWIELTAQNCIRDIAIQGVLLNYHDITERKQAEENLLESQEKLKLIIDTSPIGICTVDMLGNFVTTNQAYERMVGYAKEEIAGLSFFDVTHPNDRPKNKKLFQDMFSLETTDFSMEKRYIRKDGEEIKVSVHAIGIRDAEGNVRFGTAFVDDITERKQAEEALVQSTKRLIQAQQIAKMGDFTWDVATGEVSWSDGLFDLLKYDKTEKIDYAKVNKDIHYPDDLLEVSAWLNEGIASGEEKLLPKEYRLICKDGEVIYVRSQGIIERKEGESVKLIATLYDITERKQAEKDLQKSELKYRNQANFLDVVTENSPFAMWVSDAKGIMIRANQALRNILNLTDEMIIGKYNVFHDENLIAQGLMPVVEAVFNDLTSTRFNMFWKGTKAGDVDLSIANELWIDVSMFPITDEAGKLVNVVCQYIDITERKQAEEAMRKQKDMFELVINSVPTRIFWKDLNSVYLGCNMSFLEAVKKNKTEDVIGKNDFDLIWAKEAEKYINDDRQIIKKGIPKLGYEESYILPDGKKIWWQSSKMPLKDNTGKIIGVLATSEDVTDRKQTEKALEESEEYFRTLIENSSDVISILNDKGIITYESPSHEKVLGYETGKLIGENVFGLVHPDDRERISMQFVKLLKRSNEIEQVNFRFLHKDGTWIYIEGTGTNLLHSSKIKGIVVNYRDVTDRKQAEEVIKNQAAKWQTTFNAMSDSVSIIDLDGKISQYNAATLSLFNVNEEDIKEKKCFELVHGTKEFFNDCPLIRMKDSSQPESMIFKDKERWLKVNVDPIFNSKNELTGAVHVVSDITDRKQAEQELVEYRENLEDLVKERTKELEDKNKELERFNDLFVDREFRIKELKDQIKKLENKMDN